MKKRAKEKQRQRKRESARPIVRDRSANTLERIAERVDTFREEIARRTDTSRARSSYPQHPAAAAAAAAAAAVAAAAATAAVVAAAAAAAAEGDEAEHARNSASPRPSRQVTATRPTLYHPLSYSSSASSSSTAVLLSSVNLRCSAWHFTLPLRAEFAPSSTEFDLTLRRHPVRSPRSILTPFSRK